MTAVIRMQRTKALTRDTHCQSSNRAFLTRRCGLCHSPESFLQTANSRRVVLVAILVLFAAAGQASAAVPPDFERDVAPIFVKHCLECHHPGKTSGRLNLSTAEGVERGGESGPAVFGGKPNESPVIERAAAGEMPPQEKGKRKPLSAAELATLRDWIESGAAWPKGCELGLHEQTVQLDSARRVLVVPTHPPAGDSAGQTLGSRRQPDRRVYLGEVGSGRAGASPARGAAGVATPRMVGHRRFAALAGGARAFRPRVPGVERSPRLPVDKRPRDSAAWRHGEGVRNPD